MLSTDQARRLKNFCAQNSRRTDAMVGSFVGRFGRAFPAINFLLATETKRERYELASDLAEVAKHLGNLDAVADRLSRPGSRLGAAGFTAEHCAAFKGAVVNALRKDAVGNWSAQIGEDWGDAVDEIMWRMGIGEIEVEVETEAAPMRKAA